MVRQTRTIAETLKEAQEFLSKKTPRRVGRSIRETIEDAARFLQRGNSVPVKRVLPKKAPQPIKKNIKKVATPPAPNLKPKVKYVRPPQKAKPVRTSKSPPKKSTPAGVPQNEQVGKQKGGKPEHVQEWLPKQPRQRKKPVQENKPELPPQKKVKVAKVQVEKPEVPEAAPVVPLITQAVAAPAPEAPVKKVTKKIQKDDKAEKKTSKPKAKSKSPTKNTIAEEDHPVKQEVQDKAKPKKQRTNKPKSVEKQPIDLQGVKEETVDKLKEEPIKLVQGPRRTQTGGSDLGKPAAGIVDVVFVVDTTGSMDEYLLKTTDTVNTLISRIKEKSKEHDISVRFGFVAYRDHPPQEDTYVTKVQDLCSSAEILEYISGLDCHGGGDGAEAVLDGLNEAAIKISWRNERNIPQLRYIFHIGDQPPHGREFGGYSETWENGCPCHLTLDQVAHRINLREIHYRLIKASNTRLELMAKLFKEKFVNYEDTNLEGEARLMDIRISDMVIRELLPDYDYS